MQCSRGSWSARRPSRNPWAPRWLQPHTHPAARPAECSWAVGRQRRITGPRCQQASRRCLWAHARLPMPLQPSTREAAMARQHPARLPPRSWVSGPRRGSSVRRWCCRRRRCRRRLGRARGGRRCGSGCAPPKPWVLRLPRAGPRRDRWQRARQAAGHARRRLSQQRSRTTRTMAATASPVPTRCRWGASRLWPPALRSRHSSIRNSNNSSRRSSSSGQPWMT